MRNQDTHIKLGAKGKTCSKCNHHYSYWKLSEMDEPSDMWGLQLTCKKWDTANNEVCGGTMAWDFMPREERRAYIRKQLRGVK